MHPSERKLIRISPIEKVIGFRAKLFKEGLLFKGWLQSTGFGLRREDFASESFLGRGFQEGGSLASGTVK